MKTKFQSLFILIILSLSSSVSAQCVPGFSVIAGPAGSFTFINTTSNTTTNTTFYYDFGNGTGTTPSFSADASVTYTTNQIYTVTMFVSDSTTACFTNTTAVVTVSNVGCNANPQINYYFGQNGLTNYSHSLSNFASSTSWSFGDGNTGSGPAISHTYSVSGVYTVTAIITMPNALCTYTAISTVSVNVAPCSLVSSFTYSIGTGGIVNFMSTSTGTSSGTFYYWTFGDGNSAYSANPTHTYVNTGTYSVSLMVMDSSQSFSCTDFSGQNVLITSCPNQTSFWMLKDSTQALTWNAFPQYPSNITGATWFWGDGSSSNGLYPSHTYSAAGTYSVCLSATVSCGTSTMTCVNSAIYKPAGGSDASSGMITLHVVDPLTVGIKEQGEMRMFSLYPNPASGKIFIEFSSGQPADIEFLDLTGRSVKSVHLDSPAEVDLEGLSEGMYYLQLNQNGSRQTQKLLLRGN